MPLGPPPTLESHILLVLDDEVFLCLLQLFELVLRVLSDEPQLLKGLVDLQVLLGHGVHQGARWGRALHRAQGALSTVRGPSPFPASGLLPSSRRRAPEHSLSLSFSSPLPARTHIVRLPHQPLLVVEDVPDAAHQLHGASVIRVLWGEHCLSQAQGRDPP